MGMEEKFAGDEEEIKALTGRVLDGSHVWMLKSTRVLKKGGAKKGSEPGSGFI